MHLQIMYFILRCLLGRSWTPWAEVETIASQVQTSKEYYYATPAIQPMKIKVEDIVARIQAQPSDNHMLSEGEQHWQPWTEFEDVASQIDQSPFEGAPTNPFDQGNQVINPFGNSDRNRHYDD